MVLSSRYKLLVDKSPILKSLLSLDSDDESIVTTKSKNTSAITKLSINQGPTYLSTFEIDPMIICSFLNISSDKDTFSYENVEYLIEFSRQVAISICYIFGSAILGSTENEGFSKLILESGDAIEKASQLIVSNNKLIFQLLDNDYKTFRHPNTEFVLLYLLNRNMLSIRKNVHELKLKDPSYESGNITMKELIETDERLSKVHDLMAIEHTKIGFPFIDSNPNINQNEYIFDHECQLTAKQKARKLDYLVIEQSLGPRNDLFNIDLHSRTMKIGKLHKLVKECFPKASKLRNIPERYNGDSLIDYKKSHQSIKLKDCYLLEDIEVIAKRNLTSGV
ncbi:hypothetical protein BN7_319 [Wickerhamomyces ciferrii]|uniref:Uncharacterized protein n=1 Tax=Wickerhamomyces ciferrii (strain ATCC 14091 / BCRC 22168 / CBS 111 / JCM 3599 / NBRC 0793 / NRRL Y-1031 F-60-10) TaxID=1206466 RepID=K0K7K6_WICCF|nr:uncharacterized protein BN7_319 [Wickerhamomyces ciferrii]CCH40785.1 hypothetical protein BN7_319 [Wickerhamomyces ciferrii]